jgi:hypothetical protein
VLFPLHSSARERNLRRLLAETPPLIPVASSARDLTDAARLCPADAIWATAHGDRRRRLADLAVNASDRSPFPSEAAA